MPKRKKGTAGFVHNVEDDLYYPGTIEGTFKAKDNTTSYNVRLDGAGQVRSDNVESSGWAMSRRQLKPGDRVLVEPDEQLRYHIEVGSGTHRTSVHVSTEQIIEANQTNATPITQTEATDSQQERPQTKNNKIQTSESVSGVVIARWREDGWFYFGKVVSSENDEFWIEDGLGRKERIHKSDIFTETDQRFLNLQPRDKVVAPHPKYIFSYAPAEVKAVYRWKGADLQFFDNTTGSFPWSEMFKISQQKYTEYVHNIEQKEKEMLQTNVIVLDEKCGCFKCGKVSKYIGNQMYTVTLIDGDETVQLNQQANHMFLRKTRPSIDVDSKNLKYVIGREKDIYLPGVVCKTTDSSGKTTPDETFTVKFCNHKESSVRLDDVYPINQNYFDLVVDVLKSHK